MEYTLYMHVTPSNKKYIGITSDINVRWKNKGYAYNNQVFGRAIQKYGWDNIEHIILATNLSYESACQLEKQFIYEYNTMNPKFGYNRTEGGDGISGFVMPKDVRDKISRANKGYKHTKEACKKISDALKGREFSEEHKRNLSLAKLNQSEETRKKISEAHKRENLSEETRRKLSEASKRQVMSEETKEKIRQANLGKHHSKETRAKMRLAHLGKKYKKFDGK